MDVSQRSDNINPSATLSITAKASQLQEDGVDVVNFGAGEPDFDTPDVVKQAGIEAIENNFTRYTAASGHPDLKQAIVDKIERDQELTYEKDQVSVGCGAKHVLFNLMGTLLDPGDEVIVPSPYWVSYPNQIRYFDGTMVNVDTTSNQFVPDPGSIQQKISGHTRAILVNSPSNPTGAVIPENTLRKIGELCVENDLILISDEIYEKLIYGEQSHRSPAQLSEAIHDQTVIV
ncbi:MAG: aminotransferase class I/II-fold pyridoxal phosphate-dependent enzyme, partial [bacterium]